MSDQKTMINLISDVDSWAQSNNKYVDRKFQDLYIGEDGWEGVFKKNPPQFYRAYALALEYREKAGL